MMKIPAEYQKTFVDLMRIQCLIAAFTFCTNPLGIMLYAHQRMDIVNRVSIFGMVASLGLLVLFLVEACGIYSFIYANAITAAISPPFLFLQLPRAGVLAHPP